MRPQQQLGQQKTASAGGMHPSDRWPVTSNDGAMGRYLMNSVAFAILTGFVGCGGVLADGHHQAA
jgi:hypothetical protein